MRHQRAALHNLTARWLQDFTRERREKHGSGFGKKRQPKEALA